MTEYWLTTYIIGILYTRDKYLYSMIGIVQGDRPFIGCAARFVYRRTINVTETSLTTATIPACLYLLLWLRLGVMEKDKLERIAWGV